MLAAIKMNISVASYKEYSMLAGIKVIFSVQRVHALSTEPLPPTTCRAYAENVDVM